MAEHGALATLKDLAEKEVEDAARLLGEMRRGCLAERPEEFGALTKRLCSGLQIRLVRFDSGTRLHFLPEPGWWNR